MTSLVRDRLTWMVYAQLGAYGYFLYGFAPTVPLKRDELGIDRTLSGLHGTALAVGSIVAGLAGTMLIARFGRRAMLWGGLVGMSAGIVGYCAAHSLALSLASALVCGIASSCLALTVQSTLMDAHQESGPAALSEATAINGFAGTIAPLVIGAAIVVGLGWRSGLLVVVVLSGVLYGVFRRVRVPAPRPYRLTADQPGSRSLPRRFWLTWGALVCIVAIEFCLSLWATDLLHTRDGMGTAAATTGLSAVLVGMTIARLAGARLGLRYSLDWLLYRSLAVLLLGFVVFWMTTTGWVAFLALFVLGLGQGMCFPLALGRAVSFADGRSDLATTRVSLGTGLAIAIGPFVLGAFADHVGEHGAFLVVPVLVLGAVLGLAVSRPRASTEQPTSDELT